MNRAALVLFVTLICSAGGLGLVSAQTTATWIGPATGGLWSNPANWDIGVVPINNGANTYNVIVPAGRSIVFDINGANEIAGLNLQDTGQINFAGGRSLNVTGFTLVAGNVVADGAGSGFSANSNLTVFQPNPQLHALNGAVVQINASSYVNNGAYNASFMSALGTGSQLNLQSINSFDQNGDWNYAGVHTVEAGQGGVVNLSGLQTVDGSSNDDTLRFWIHTGGNINLQNLTTITKTNAQPGARTLFDVAVPSYLLPKLENADGVEFRVHPGNTIQLPVLTTMRDGRLDLQSGATINAPLLSNIQGSYIKIAGGSGFNTNQLSQVNDAELHAHASGSITTTATSYVNNRVYNRSFMSALGTGSQLNLQSINSFDQNGDWNYAGVHTVEAGQGGVVNLSGLQTVDGSSNDDTLRFWIHTGGNINLQNLTTITKTNAQPGARTLFDVDSGNYTLPNLVAANGAAFDAAPFTSISLPKMTSLVDGRLDVGALATINAPMLVDVRGSYIRISGGTAVITSPFTSINDAEFHAHSSGAIATAATSYVNNRVYNRSFMSALGTGSQLNLQSINSFDQNGDWNYAGVHTVEAGQGGVVNLSGLQTVDGSSNDDTLRFFSSSTGRINIGTAGQTTNLVGGRTRFEVTGTNSVIRFGSNMNMAANTEMKATLNGRFEAEGSLSISTTNPANFDLKDGILRMVGNGAGGQLQSLEVISADTGIPVGPLGNIGQIGQLQIGTAQNWSRVILQNAINNHGSILENEALYLQGFPATNGLNILEDSVLILNGQNVYVSNGQGDFTSLRSLIPQGQLFTLYGGGIVALTPDLGEVLNGDFELGGGRVLPAFNITSPTGAGGARLVDAPRPGRPANRAVELYAGSEVNLSQHVSTLETAFSIEFDAWAKDSSGTLSVLLDNVLLGSWDYTELSGGDFSELSIMVNDPSLWGLIDKSLTFRWDANTGHRVWLDNIQMIAVPEPGTGLALLLLGLSWNLGRRRRAG